MTCAQDGGTCTCPAGCVTAPVALSVEEIAEIETRMSQAFSRAGSE